MGKQMKTKRVIFSILMAAALSNSARATCFLGTAFTYQGRLTDGGTLANGNYDMRFGLYVSPSSQSPFAGFIERLNVPVNNGLFTVSLDFGQRLASYQWYLGIALKPASGPTYTPLVPYQLLTPTPFATYSSVADSATSASSTAANSVSTTSLTDSAVTTSKMADNSVTAPKIASGQVVKSLNG